MNKLICAWGVSCIALSACHYANTTVTSSTAEPHIPFTQAMVRTTSVQDICTHGTGYLRHWSRERDNSILIKYGFRPGKHPHVQIDHLVPLGIGGSDNDVNLWAQPRNYQPDAEGTSVGFWGAETKDRLEFRMRDLICYQGYQPATLQREIADNWIAAYKRYVGDH